jgi:hypothetical protein
MRIEESLTVEKIRRRPAKRAFTIPITGHDRLSRRGETIRNKNAAGEV